MTRSRLWHLTLVVLLTAAVAPGLTARRGRQRSPDMLIDTVAEIRGNTAFSTASGARVLTTSTTLFVNLECVSDLTTGDLVEVRGEHEGLALVADQVTRLQTAAAPVTVTGEVALILEPDTFVLADGTRARVGASTEYVGLAGFLDLRAGDEVAATGVADADETVRVTRLEHVGHRADSLRAFLATVAAAHPPEGVALSDGTFVTVRGGTILEGLEGVADLLPGDRLWVEALTTEDPMQLTARRLVLLRTAGTPVAFSATVAAVATADSFTTLEGQLVRVGPDTVLVGIADVASLAAGMRLRIEGVAGTATWEVWADRIELADTGAPDGGGAGLVTTRVGRVERVDPPAGMVVDDTAIVVDSATQFSGGLGGYADLAAGMAVHVVAQWQASGDLLALTVEDLDPLGGGIVVLQGVVVATSDADRRYRLADGSWVFVPPTTPVDGDVDRIEHVLPGDVLEAHAVGFGGNLYRALWVLVRRVADEFDLPWSGPGGESITREALVVLADGASATAVAGRYGARVAGRLPGTLVHLFVWPEPVGNEVIDLLSDDDEVAEVEPNYHFQDSETIRRRMIAVDRQPTSDEYTQQTALAAIDLDGVETTGRGTVVAVIDTGVDPFHPLLRHRVSAAGWDFVDQDPWPWETADGLDQDFDGDVDEAAGHGTFVSGLVLLVAPSATILPYRVLDDEGHGTTFAICQAVLAAVDAGADVLNMSFGFHLRSRILDRLLDEAQARGVVLVAGAGNDAAGELPFPARDHRVLAVAATSSAGALADFSNFGEDAVLAAPGVELYSGGVDGVFGTWSGTSMAAPLVSGAVALLRAHTPRLRPEEVAAALLQARVPLSGEPLGVGGLLQVDAALALVPADPP